jgi:hypothetical protein
MAHNKSILDLVPEHLKPLLPLEEKLVQAAPQGVEVSDFPDGPIDMAQIGEAQTVRSEILVWLLTTPEVRNNIHHKGIRLRGAKITGILDLENSNLEQPLRLVNCIIEEKMILDRGTYSLLDFSGSQTGPIQADSIQAQYDVLMQDGFKAKGEVCLLGANIGGDLDCNGGEFENPEGDALSCDCITTQGAVFLCDGFKAKGEVRLLGAKIGGNLECTGGEFENPDRDALSGDNLTLQGGMYLRDGFKAKGGVRLIGANICGNLECKNAEFEANFIGQNMKVGGNLVWQNVTVNPKLTLNLANANLAYIIDDKNSWPKPGNLMIDGLVYGPFHSSVPADSKTRLEWLKLQNPGNLNVQPYEQLIRVFRQMGLNDDARDVAIAKQRLIRKRLRGISRLWSWILDFTISYGYRPEKVFLLFILPIILLGALVFTLAFQAGVVEPTASQQQLSSKNPTFDPLGYSLDVFLPIVDLHQESAWEPNPDIKYGIFYQYYMYFHILAGWFFTTLAVAAVTGLVRSD